MKIKDVMTVGVFVVAPTSTVQEAALKMKEGNVGLLPVCEWNQLIGIVTDRDVAMESTALGTSPQVALVRDVMSAGAISVRQDEDLHVAERLMEEHHIRRLPVVNEAGNLVGIIGLADIANKAKDQETLHVLQAVATPK